MALPAARSFAAAPGLSFAGKFIQSGVVIARTAPRANYSIDGESLGVASAGGLFVMGFDRDAPGRETIDAAWSGGKAEHVAEIAPQDYDIQRINGLPQNTVTPQGEALLKRIAEEAERKRAGFASNVDADWFADGFSMPLKDYRVSGRFGGQRILNGKPDRPHYGADLAAPIGTPIMAPCKGKVSFAETGLHYEGGLVLIDHGQGLISAYLHMSRIDVQRDQMVDRGEVIGAVGDKGRATGPHLCWRLKWRARNLDPTQFVGVTAPPPGA